MMIIVSTLVGAGYEREVYLHPSRDDRVIKISKNVAVNRNHMDHAYLSAIKPHSILPRMHGWVDTQMGPGLVFERVRDADGETSVTLKIALRTGRVTPEEGRSLLKGALSTLRKDGIILHDDKTLSNFVVQEGPGSRRLIMVDGFGPSMMTRKARLRMRFPLLALGKTLRCSFNLNALLKKEVKALNRNRKLVEGVTLQAG